LGRDCFCLLHLAEAAPDLLLGALADRAGVVEHDIRGVGVGGEAVAQARELAHDQLGVELVHLAAEGLEIDGFLCHAGVYAAPRAGL
jgi:hypothetical protein